MKSFAVIGLGRFGSQVAQKLFDYGGDVLAIDTKETLVDRIADHVTRAVTADAREKDVLRRLGVADCDCAIVALGSDLAASVLITMNLKALGVGHVICKARDDTYREILEKLGADQVFIPERIVADRLSASLLSPDALRMIELSEEYGIVEIKAPASWDGKTIRALGIRTRYGVSVIAVRDGETLKVAPAADLVVGEGMTLVLLGDYDKLEALHHIR